MKVVIDTNVLISGIFFNGPPSQIVKAWHDQSIHVMISQSIVSEYWRVAEILSDKHPGIELSSILGSLFTKAYLIDAPALPEVVCLDKEDDKFVACALAGGSKLIISGDKHLLKVSGYQGIEVIKPMVFLENYFH